MRRRISRYVIACFVLCLGLVFSALPVAASGTGAPDAAVLTIAPVSWGIIGLDSNNVNVGPNVFMIGARVCNTGDTAATNLVVTFAWDSANPYINLLASSSNPLAYDALAAGECALFNYDVEITRDAAAYDTARGYHISVSADGLAAVSTPTPRELYVEHILSQNRNGIDSITGPATVILGGTYTYVVIGSTAPGGYEQLVDSTPFSNSLFEIQQISVQYEEPVGGTNDQEYADACGWDPVPTSPTYRTCIGPANYVGGKAGGVVATTYTVKVTGIGMATLTPIIYDFSGSSYHYNSDYGESLTVIAGPPTSVAITALAAQPSRAWLPGVLVAPALLAIAAVTVVLVRKRARR